MRKKDTSEKAKTRNTYRRAIYKANKIVRMNKSVYSKEMSQKKFKKMFREFSEMEPGLMKGKGLEEQLNTFIGYRINKTSEKQAESGARNLLSNSREAVAAFNEAKEKGGFLPEQTRKLLNALINAGAARMDDDGKYNLIESELPTKEDLLSLSNKYLKLKRTLIDEFGDDVYGEAYGSN